MYYNKISFPHWGKGPRRFRQWAAGAGMGLSAELWLVQAGIFANMLGYGAVLPFEIIYLHNGRGFSLTVAGLVTGTITGAAVLSAPLTGPVVDRFGPRRAVAVAGVIVAAGYGGLAFARTPALAFAAAALAGAGNGALSPGQSALLAALAPAGLRHRAGAVSRVATNAGIGLGGAAGGLLAARGLPGFVLLFLANAVTYLVYVAVLVAVVRETPRPGRSAGGYRDVLRDGAFRRLAAANLIVIAVGWGTFTWLLPPFARSTIGLPASLIGLLLAANAVTVVVVQVPVARLAEGRRRVRMMALAAVVFAGCCLLVIAAGAVPPGAAYALLLVACVAVGAGECFYTATLMPLTAELAPDGLRGRYMAVLGFSWWAGLALAPALGGPLLSRSPAAVFAVAGAASAAAAVVLTRLEARLPAQARRTPRPAPAAPAATGRR